MTFAEKLRELRTDAALSRESLSQACGLSRGVIRDYEQGKRKPTLESAVKLARALGVTCEAFAGCEDVDADGERSAPKKPARATPSTPPAGELEGVPKKGRRKGREK